ncbi:hypothetical protein VKS41_000099 [Umbelopsis sp. WA50703]
MTNSPVERTVAPSLSGYPLVVLTNLLERLPLVADKIAADGGLHVFRKRRDLDDAITTVPVPVQYNCFQQEHSNEQKKYTSLSSDSSPSPFLTYHDYIKAYKEGKITPTDVAERVLKAIKNSKHLNVMRSFDEKSIREQAAASTDRYKADQPLSDLDGIFIPVKEESDIKGYESRVGTVGINVGNVSPVDSTVVQRLRDAGAIIVGHAAMNEIGWDTFTVNPNTGTPKNAYNLKCSCGGSSGGSGGAVASGIFPIAIGADGGGSIRIPASFCGLYGLKATHARISGFGCQHLAPTVGVSGPIAASADDMALTYAIIAGRDEKDQATFMQPPVKLDSYTNTKSLDGLRIGIFKAWNDHVMDPIISEKIEVFKQHFASLGATFVDIEIPELEDARKAHAITISTEISNYVRSKGPVARGKLLYSNRILCCVADTLKPVDYVRAQQIRTRCMQHVMQLFKPADGKGIDLILTPSTAITSPELHPSLLTHGMSNNPMTSDAMRYAFLANFIGIPAVQVPAGFDARGLPVGLQLMAEWWNEELLLRMAKVCEETPGVERKKPTEGWFGDIL